MGDFFLELTILVFLASLLSIVFRILKQPPILAYILAGIIIGPFGDLQLQNRETLQALGQLGITLLLFMVGLELRIKELRTIGKVALATGIAQIVFTSLIGYFICLQLGFSPITSIYLSIALAFSSTIVIVKLLSDKKDLNSLYGKISVGFLLVQDFFAIVVLILLSGFSGENASLSLGNFGLVVIKGVLLFISVLFLSVTILPKIIAKIAHSSETLFLFSIAWALGVSALVSSQAVGFSVEIGGFLAGLALANSTENYQIVSKVRGLRDFFITIFFVTIGMGMAFSSFSQILLPAILLSLFVLIGNPIIIMVIMGLIGYRRRTSFLAGLTVAQISEFSLILVFLGNRLGHISDQIVSLTTMVGAITFTLSTYMIMNGNYLYRKLNRYLFIFEKKNTKEENMQIDKEGFEDLKDHVVLIGANRTGRSILEALEDEREKLAVVDFDPDVVSELKERGIKSIFGDIVDTDIQERVALDKAKLIISTISDIEDNLLLLQSVDKQKEDEKRVIVLAQEPSEAKVLYEAGAHYVVLPHLAGGRHLAKIIKDDNLDRLEVLKALDLAVL